MLEPHEEGWMENIIREARKGLRRAEQIEDDYNVDCFNKIIDDAKYLLPNDNRFK